MIVPGGHGRVACRVAWRRYEEDCDVAILVSERYLVPADVARTFATVRWGVIEDLAPRPGAHAVGYPRTQRDERGELDSEQLVGTLKPASGLLRGRQALDSLHGAPAATDGHGSPWAGFSGAAVFVDDYLVGVVRSDPAQWQHGRVEITPTTAIVRSPGIHEASSENHLDLVWFALDPPDSEDEFEERLRSYIAQQSGGTHIIGMSRGGSDEEYWLLDSNYLSLELVGGRARQFPVSDPAEADKPAEPQRAEQALSGHRRVLIRGAAGSGKTTLMQWLATVTARRELPPPLAELKDCVPLLLRLRTLVRLGELPAPEEFLTAVAKPLTGLPGVGELSAVSRMTSLRKLALGRPASAGPITLPPRIIELSVTEHWDVAGLEHCTALATLAIGLGRSATDLWHRLSGLPALAHLLVFDVSVSDLALAQPLHRLWALTLVDVSDPEQLWRLRMICPNLRLLSIVADPDSFDHARLAASLPDCNLIISGPDSD